MESSTLVFAPEAEQGRVLRRHTQAERQPLSLELLCLHSFVFLFSKTGGIRANEHCPRAPSYRQAPRGCSPAATSQQQDASTWLGRGKGKLS